MPALHCTAGGILTPPRRRRTCAEIPAYELSRSVRDLRELPAQLWERYGERLDIWTLASFRGQNRRERAWNVALRILPHGAEDALGWRFHPTQTTALQPDGSVLVRFQASGMRELAWHLFTWGDKVEILKPDSLRDAMRMELAAAVKALDSGQRRTSADRSAAASTLGL